MRDALSPMAVPVAATEDQVLGLFCKAMSVCPVHHRYVMSDILTMALPPIRLKQYRFFNDGPSFGVLTWAFLDETAAQQHIENRVPLSIEQWRSGNQTWIISLIGRRINPRHIVEVAQNKLKMKSAKYLRRDCSMTVLKTVHVFDLEGRLQVRSSYVRK
ncbi:toxin-activating lysine-acyltransferase [Pontivivens ytuae]|uniref:RTX toxin-activating lysine-acyltransferase n=1 Tax=Pontivivens ytuae TaxID=2789856 RepID=A0A7S9LUJ5_9RHOB|nr:toxin-activating lysine-acyltransferase [Pontivivens ytuae]QPH55592.1 toxin-activating lysine-acyltransferase [Pontivivens ytuae]